jgi:hypothetical protein
MPRFGHNRAARIFPVLLGICLAIGAPPRSDLSAAQPEAISVDSDGGRVSLTSPYLHLEFDLEHPQFDVIKVDPFGNRRFGDHVGSITAEASSFGEQLRSASDDLDGALASWSWGPRSVRLTLEGIDSGQLTTSTWIVTVPFDAPTIEIERTTTFTGSLPVDGIGLAVTSPSGRPEVEPSSLAPVLNGTTYRLELWPALLEQAGGTLGLLAVDNPELTYSARTEQPDRVVARQEAGATTLTFVRRFLPARRSGQLDESVVFRFGWNNHFLKPLSDFDPETESRLLAAGYFGNAVVSPTLGAVLTASMRDYRGSIWSRDTDYALQGYSYVLNDMSVFGNTLQKLLDRVDDFGIAPEFLLLDGHYGNRESWDSMPNVIQSVHSYVSKTGDIGFYRRNEASVKKAADWIRSLDTDDDGLPDVDVFPYGYTDTVENGPMHTYAVAKFYAAFLGLADLEEAAGKPADRWRQYAAIMQASFNQPLDSGGYWNPETGYPIAWKRADGQVYEAFETFGVFEAIRVGLLGDPAHLQSVAAWLAANRTAFVNSNAYPERLMIGGYDLAVKKDEVPPDKLWIMDCNAPWIIGLSVPARVRLGQVEDAREMLALYAASADRSTPHAEFGAGPLARYGPGETYDGGRLWDNWAWFSAVYGTHFGLRMRPWALEIAPAPLDPALGRHLSEVTYQGARVELDLLDAGYRVTLDASRQLELRPPLGYSLVDLNDDGNFQPTRKLRAAPGTPYVVRALR